MRLIELLKTRTRKASQERKVEHALAYVRVSHERSAEKNTSPATQRGSILRHAEQKRCIIKRWYADLDR